MTIDTDLTDNGTDSSNEWKANNDTECSVMLVPVSESHLRTILEVQAGIDLTDWGTEKNKSVGEMYKEILKEVCKLRLIPDVGVGGNGCMRIERVIRVLMVRGVAHTRMGERRLRQRVLLDNLNNKVVRRPKRDSYPCKKLYDGDIKEQLENMLANDLQLDRKWIKEHFVLDDVKVGHEQQNGGQELPQRHA